MTDPLHGHWEVPGLPDNWPALLADALSELSDAEYRQAWLAIGNAIHARSRVIRDEILRRETS
jgi:hypothetical protein